MNFPEFEDSKITVAFSTKKLTFEALLSELQLIQGNLVAMLQVHSDKIAWVGKEDLGKKLDQTDALITKERDVFLAVRVADCVAVVFFDPTSKFVGAAHCGWRGTKAELAAEVAHEMKKAGADLASVKVALLPSARNCCYEVGEDLARYFSQQFGSEVISIRDGKSFLNLQLCLKKQLINTGVEESNIFDSGVCTIHSSDEFHSFRADHSKGHNVAIIGLRS